MEVEDILERVAGALNAIGPSRIKSASVGQSPLRRTKSVVISHTADGQWEVEEDVGEDGLIVYVAIKYHQLSSVVRY